MSGFFWFAQKNQMMHPDYPNCEKLYLNTFRTLSSDSQQLEALIHGFTDRGQNKTFLPVNTTHDFLAIRPSGNPITAEGLAGMYDNADLVIELSELIKIIV